MTLLTRTLCRVGCVAAALAAVVAYSPRAGVRSSREVSLLAGGDAPTSAVMEARAVVKAGAAHRRLSPLVLRARGEEIGDVTVGAPRVFGVEIDTPLTTAFSSAHSPRAPPARVIAIRAS